MTLEQTTSRIQAAVQARDIDALQAAAKERASAIALLPSLSPTPELRDAIAASIAAGEEARRTIRATRRRVGNIQHGFLRALTPAAKHQVDCKG
jgi:hypothetical protein